MCIQFLNRISKSYHKSLNRSLVFLLLPSAVLLFLKGEVVRGEDCCLPFVGIHIRDQCVCLGLVYCSLFPGHLYTRVNTAAQRLTTSHLTDWVILLFVGIVRSVT